MKKRKIFYFLKTKEEYDYMLAGGLIPKRGIVLIESTREIFKNGLAYSGYGPLKSYFESLKTELLSFVLDKNQDISSMVDLINLKLQEDVSGYNELFGVKLTKLQNQISLNAENISDIIYYRDNTLVSSLLEIKNDTERLDNKYSEVLLTVSKNEATVNSFKSSIESLINNIYEFKSGYNSELDSLRSTILTNQQTNSEGGISEARVRNIVREMLLSDSDFSSKVKITVNPLLELLKQEINASVTAKIREAGGTISSSDSSSSGSSNYQSAVEYADNLFNTHATASFYGTVRIGNYLRLDESEKLTIDVTALKQALNWGINDGLSTSLVTNSNINTINHRLDVLEAIVSDAVIETKIRDLLYGVTSTQSLVNLIDWNNVYSSDGFSTGVKNVLRDLQIIDANGEYTASIATGTLNDLLISGNTLNYQLTEGLNGYVQLLFKSNANNFAKVTVDNAHGLIIQVDKNNALHKKITIGIPENSGIAKDFKITFQERRLDGNGYLTLTGCDETVTIGNVELTFVSGICVGINQVSNG